MPGRRTASLSGRTGRRRASAMCHFLELSLPNSTPGSPGCFPPGTAVDLRAPGVPARHLFLSYPRGTLCPSRPPVSPSQTAPTAPDVPGGDEDEMRTYDPADHIVYVHPAQERAAPAAPLHAEGRGGAARSAGPFPPGSGELAGLVAP